MRVFFGTAFHVFLVFGHIYLVGNSSRYNFHSIRLRSSSHIFRQLQAGAAGGHVIEGGGLRPGVAVHSIYVDEVQVQ